MRAKSRAYPKLMAGSEAVLGAQPAAADDELAACCPDLDQWPTSWMYEERDLSPGQHRDNLWLLGGELISDLHEAPRLRQRPIKGVVLQALDDEGGPLISQGAAEEQQRSFDATCRKFYRFLKDCDSS